MKPLIELSIIILCLAMIVIFSACGDEYKKKEANYDYNKVPGLEFSSEVSSAISKNCKSCHASEPFIKDPNLFRSKAIPMIESGKMPPGGNISNDEKSLLIQFKDI